MATTKTEMRRCTGSTRFGIAAHGAPISDFPRQPSRKDGLGTMCAEHWRAYVKGLREARAAAGEAPKPAKPALEPRTRALKPGKPPANGAAVAKAEVIIAEVDALPGPEMVARVGDADVQAAFETVNGARHGGKTPLGEAMDGGIEEADAA